MSTGGKTRFRFCASKAEDEQTLSALITRRQRDHNHTAKQHHKDGKEVQRGGTVVLVWWRFGGGQMIRQQGAMTNQAAIRSSSLTEARHENDPVCKSANYRLRFELELALRLKFKFKLNQKQE